jgi:threonine/homoserine efflux transporter RhtA
MEALPLAYAAAVIGFLLPQVLAWAALAVLEARAYGSVQALEQRRAALRETWGVEVERPPG